MYLWKDLQLRFLKVRWHCKGGIKLIRANRIKALPPYIFEKQQKKIESIENGRVINLGIGNPHKQTPENIILQTIKAIREPRNHGYPSYDGLPSFKEAIASYYKERFGVKLDSQYEILPLKGAKEGFVYINLCYVNPGNLVLVPDPGYQIYSSSCILAGGDTYTMPLLPENNYLPDLDAIPEYIAKYAKIMFLNYPNNPTGAVATREFFRQVVDFAKKNKIIVCHDLVYGEIFYDENKPVSFLETPGAKGVGIEISSLTAPYNMAGWRVGYAVGDKEIIKTVIHLKANLDSGTFLPLQVAAKEALEGEQQSVKLLRETYKRRRDLVVETLVNMGIKVEVPKATFYLWVKVPSGYTSESFAEMVLEKAGVVVTPGTALGRYGEGYVRIALTAPCDDIKEAMIRIKTQLNL